MAEGSQSQAPKDAGAWLAAALGAEKEGEFFRAFDMARQGYAEFPDDRRLAHRAVLSLANAGATEEARRLYDGWKLERYSDEDIAALDARLLKDGAYAKSGAERRAALLAAAERYHAVAEANGFSYYPGINAASLFFLAGDEGRARSTAARLLPALEAAREAGSTDYWRLATLVEVYFLLGDAAGARKTLPQAIAASGGNIGELSATWRQLRRLDALRGGDESWLEELRPPRVVHFTGHIISPPGQPGRFPAEAERHVKSAIANYLARARPGFAYGSLAAGADILFAEAILAAGAELHIVLPFAREEFVAVSVAPAGPPWVTRFEACLARAKSVRFATQGGYLGDDRLFAYCSQIAVGLAVLRADRLGGPVEQVAVWDGQAGGAGLAGTAADLEFWRSTGLPQTIIPCGEPGERPAPHPPSRPPAARAEARLSRAMLFGDVKGFSKLTDTEMPRYVEHFVGRLGRIVAAQGGDVVLANTWGDGIFLVFENVDAAARCALALQDGLREFDYAGAGLPDHLRLRIGCHFGPVYECFDPVLRKTNFFGSNVSFAARIEPITPEGCVYVTEPFAAILAATHAKDYRCEYVGMTETAKSFGRFRMFLLRPAQQEYRAQ